LAATTEEEVTKVFDQFGQPYARDFVPRLSSDILLLLKDKDFPQRPIPRIKFLARSLAGRSTLSFRSSRDICEAESSPGKAQVSISYSSARVLHRMLLWVQRTDTRQRLPRLRGAASTFACGLDWQSTRASRDKTKKEKGYQNAEPEFHEEIATAMLIRKPSGASAARRYRCEPRGGFGSPSQA